MPNGIWNKETYLMDVPDIDKKRASMTFDMLADIHKTVTNQPQLCQTIMDKKITTNNKINRKINLGIGSSGGISVVALWEFVRSIWN